MTMKAIYQQAVAKHGEQAVNDRISELLSAMIRPAPRTDAGIVAEVIADLNRLARTSYRPTAKKTKTLIKARLADGYTLEDLKKVNWIMAKTWMDNDYNRYLRPSTLYSADKFEGYLQQYNRYQQQEADRKRRAKVADFMEGSNTPDKPAKAPKKPPIELKPWYQYASLDELAVAMWNIEDAKTYEAYECPPELRAYQQRYHSMHLRKYELNRARSCFDQLRAAEQAKRGLK